MLTVSSIPLKVLVIVRVLHEKIFKNTYRENERYSQSTFFSSLGCQSVTNCRFLVKPSTVSVVIWLSQKWFGRHGVIGITELLSASVGTWLKKYAT